MDRQPEALGRRTRLDLALVGDVRSTIKALLPRLSGAKDRRFLDAAKRHYAAARAGLDDLAMPRPGDKRIHPQYLTRLVSEPAADDAILTADVGYTDRLGRALSGDERQRPSDWLVQSWLDGECFAAGVGRSSRLSTAPSSLAVRRWRLYDADGGFISLVQLGPIINGGGDEVIELAQTNLRR